MQRGSTLPFRTGRRRPAALMLFALLLAVFGAAQDRSAPAPAEPPDAVIELWEQHWALNADGSTTYHAKQHVRLNNERAYGAFADPRITYNKDTQQLEIIVARTKRPDGTYRELPDYSYVEVAPSAAAGWPAFVGLRQQVVVMSGVEPGCVVELEYRVTTKPGAAHGLAADVRFDHVYPVRLHTVSVTRPSVPLTSSRATRRPEGADEHAVTKAAGGTTETWTVRDLPANPDEPQAQPWQNRCERLAFTTAPGAEAFVRECLTALDRAADDAPLLAQLVREWLGGTDSAAALDAQGAGKMPAPQPGGPSTDSQKLRLLQEKLAATFNFVDFPVEWQPPGLRPASETLSASYGLPAEAAAALLALARNAGLPVRPGLLSNDDIWVDQVAQPAFVAAYVVVLDTPDGPQVWHPQHGRLRHDRTWTGQTLFAARADTIEQVVWPAWRDPAASRCQVDGNIAIAADGNYAGKLTFELTGLFAAAAALETRDGQLARFRTLAGAVFPGTETNSYTVRTLSDERVVADLEIKSAKPLPKLFDDYRLEFAQTTPALLDVAIPLVFSRRETPARLAGAFEEQIDVAVTWPASWKLEAAPQVLGAGDAPNLQRTGTWGAWQQSVTPLANGLRLQRTLRVVGRDLAPPALLALRDLLNAWRTEAARTLLLRP